MWIEVSQKKSFSFENKNTVAGALETSGGTQPVAATGGNVSKRSEDEEIRSSRQARMAEMGLSGRPSSAWADQGDSRANATLEEEERSDSSTSDDPDDSLAPGVSAFAVGMGKVMSDADSKLSPEQFTLCVPSPR